MLRLLPVQNPEEMGLIYSTGRIWRSTLGGAGRPHTRCIQDFPRRKARSVFLRVLPGWGTDSSLSFGGQTERVTHRNWSRATSFQALGVGPALGRVILTGE
jgi:hypothetical protein